jgi:hypothetical protein
MNKTTKHLEWDTALLGAFALFALTAWTVLVLQGVPFLQAAAQTAVGRVSF